MPTAPRTALGRRWSDRRLSRKLTKLLRHDAANVGLTVRADGFVSVGALQARLAAEGIDMDDNQLRRIVFADAKERYALHVDDAGENWVRANQGHTMTCVKLEAVSTRLPPGPDTPFKRSYHGTSQAAWASIRTTGLSRMNRNAIQMAIGRPGDPSVKIISGMRADCECVIEIDMVAAWRSGSSSTSPRTRWSSARGQSRPSSCGWCRWADETAQKKTQTRVQILATSTSLCI